MQGSPRIYREKKTGNRDPYFANRARRPIAVADVPRDVGRLATDGLSLPAEAPCQLDFFNIGTG
jgi:hypothetical protein